MIIGNFNKIDGGSFWGEIQTLTLNLKVRIDPVAEKKAENAPDYRVWAGHTELGAAWKETSTAGNVYLSVRLDDPALPAPITCALVKTSSEIIYRLIWERNRKKARKSAPDAEF